MLFVHKWIAHTHAVHAHVHAPARTRAQRQTRTHSRPTRELHAGVGLGGRHRSSDFHCDWKGGGQMSLRQGLWLRRQGFRTTWLSGEVDDIGNIPRRRNKKTTSKAARGKAAIKVVLNNWKGCPFPLQSHLFPLRGPPFPLRCHMGLF